VPHGCPRLAECLEFLNTEAWQFKTVQATELVHEAYVRLVADSDPGWDSRAHFFDAAARAMQAWGDYPHWFDAILRFDQDEI
jgi:hypothetical protein